jgi:membrane protein DedA with SNARE-associated domain
MSGVLIGDTILFILGGKLGMRVLENERIQTIFSPEKVHRTRAYFRKYGDKIVFFARFVAGFRSIAFFMSGTLKMEYRRFLFLDAAAALLSVPIWIGMGYGLGHYLGDEISQILRSMRHLKTAFTLLVFGVGAFVALRAYLRYRGAKKISIAKAAAREESLPTGGDPEKNASL